MKNNNLLRYAFALSLLSGFELVQANFLRDLGEVVMAPVEVAADVAETGVVATADVAETAVVGTEEIVTAPFRGHHHKYDSAYESGIDDID